MQIGSLFENESDDIFLFLLLFLFGVLFRINDREKHGITNKFLQVMFLTGNVSIGQNE